jgi:hypothetical protein
MFNPIIVFAYFLIIYISLFLSFLKRKENKFHIYIYFLLVAIIETLSLIVKGTTLFYQLGSLFYTAFFTIYYAHFSLKFKNVFYFLGAISFLAIFYFVMQFDENFPTAIGIIISALYIVFAIVWFYEQISHPNKDYIISKQGFWISTANLIWGIIFLFRTSLMYWLLEHDPAFLILIDKIFKISVLITYLLLFIAVTRKQYPAHE